MAERTATRTMETDGAPESVFAVLTDPRRIPAWAPAFADRVDPGLSDTWSVTRDGVVFAVRVAIHEASRAVDYLREIAPGRQGGAYLRVLPRPGGGAVVVMTLPVPPGGKREQVEDTLQQELEALVRLAAFETA